VELCVRGGTRPWPQNVVSILLPVRGRAFARVTDHSIIDGVICKECGKRTVLVHPLAQGATYMSVLRSQDVMLFATVGSGRCSGSIAKKLFETRQGATGHISFEWRKTTRSFGCRGSGPDIIRINEILRYLKARSRLDICSSIHLSENSVHIKAM
jgi:hypothetical protein